MSKGRLVGAASFRAALWGASLVVGSMLLGACFPASNSPDTLARERILTVAGDDRLPNRTASDWVTYADHVVLVKVDSEREIPPSESELEAGEGIILRSLTMRVEEVLWSSPGAARPAPRSFEWTAFGWRFQGSPAMANRVKVAGEDQPRFEVGESYVMAIEWDPARCTQGDTVPGGWRGLGSDSSMPYAGRLGMGELMGRAVTLTERRAMVDSQGPNFGLEDRMVGRSLDDLADVLQRARPEPKEQYGPAPAPCPQP